MMFHVFIFSLKAWSTEIMPQLLDLANLWASHVGFLYGNVFFPMFFANMRWSGGSKSNFSLQRPGSTHQGRAEGKTWSSPRKLFRRVEMEIKHKNGRPLSPVVLGIVVGTPRGWCFVNAKWWLYLVQSNVICSNYFTNMENHPSTPK